ncbi:Iron import ATP-binding/permease protein IrtA [anaerobic digester metagenome]
MSIARCLLRETPVLLVDEATAALDPVTSFGISNSILDLQDLTRIVVTHELDEQLLSRYDSILVLRQGRLEEVGSFADLMASRQYFYSLFNVAQNAADEPLKKDEMPVPHS